MSETAQPPQGQPQGQPQQPGMAEQVMGPLADILSRIAAAGEATAQANAAIAQSIDRAMQAMAMVAQAQMAPRRIIKDADGSPVGSEPIL